ncbi:hypothetical protein [Spongiactinospora sp. TRM90649]|uniref:hypothetical protein n=1 Tax=Spongiactinospora sp. TRM90649 TaxID=3031114 RepID=UPI0023F7C406|nr:hypothetical protein [Spongiactinospora sp. TRM90649]MDF5755093.1 hypothetical protein [Spongiactinospora sp. TRM90649]
MPEQRPDLVVGRLRRRLCLAVLVITCTTHFGIALPLLLANPEIYSSLARQRLAFAILVAVLVVAGARILRDRPLGWSRWVMVAAVFIASALATTGIPPADLVAEEEWSYGVIGWFLLLLTVEHSATTAAILLGLYTFVSFAQLVLVGQPHLIVDLVVVSTIVLGCELPVLAAAITLKRVASTALAAAADAERTGTADAIAEHLHADRRSRYADLGTTCIPLLTELAAGTADLADDRVRAAYAVAAARTRRLIVEHDDVEDPLTHELRACLDLAERNGVAVYLGTHGDRPTPPLRVRRALTEPVVRLMATAVSQARVTVLGTPTAVTVSVIADVGPEEPTGGQPSPDAGQEGIIVTWLADGPRVWLEATWQAEN